MAAKRFPVEASHVMMFARAVGDYNPVYHDEEQAKQSEVGGIIAPPTFTVAAAQFDPDYGLRPRPGVPWFGSGKQPSGMMRPPPSSPPKSEAKPVAGADKEEKPAAQQAQARPRAGGGGLHAEQHFEYHRPLRPGDVLRAESKPGRSWEKESKRAGKLKFREAITEYYDQDGQLVITARSVGMTTERVIDSSKGEG